MKTKGTLSRQVWYQIGRSQRALTHPRAPWWHCWRRLLTAIVVVTKATEFPCTKAIYFQLLTTDGEQRLTVFHFQLLRVFHDLWLQEHFPCAAIRYVWSALPCSGSETKQYKLTSNILVSRVHMTKLTLLLTL
jgi:hypothetical protein